MYRGEIEAIVEEIAVSDEVVFQDCPRSVLYSYIRKINQRCAENGYDWHVVHKVRPDGSFLIMKCRNLQEGESVC